MTANNKAKETRISAAKNAHLLNLRELWDYRDLLELLVRRDVTVKYRQTILGPLWLVLQPLALTMVFSGVFSSVGGFSTDGVPPPLFYLAGLVPWAYFSQVFGQVASSLHSNVHLFSKVYFPRLVIPLSAALSGLVGLAIQLACFVSARGLYSSVTLSTITFGGYYTWLCLPIAFVLLVVFTFGAGLWMAVLTARYRDLMQVTPFLVQVLMYVTPLIFPLSSVPEQYKLLASLNPLAMVLEAFRSAVFGLEYVPVDYFIMPALITVTITASGLWAFSFTERNVVDSI